MTVLRLVDPLGERLLHAADLPLGIGGSGAALVLPGLEPGAVIATLEQREGGFYLQAVVGSGVLLDGTPVETARRVDDGAIIDCGSALLKFTGNDDGATLVVEHDAVGHQTLPPLQRESALAEAAADASQPLPITVIEYTPPSGRRAARRRQLPGWGRIVLAAAGLAVVALLGLLLASVAVTVRTTPELTPDTVDFAGTAFDLRIGDRQLVLPGHYRLEVSAAGYAPASVEAEVTRAADQVFVVALQRLPGFVDFDTGGVAATLTVDGRNAGTLPGRIELPAGQRELLVQAPHYREIRQSLQVEGGGQEQSLSLRLEPAFAAVSISSVPAGATIRVDGEELGVTPLQTQLDEGRHTLRLEHPAFRDFEAPITVKAGEPLNLGPIELGLPDGTLRVRSTPAGAAISVAGQYRGQTPLSLALRPGVPIEVSASLSGYRTATRQAEVGSGAHSELSLTLEPILGEVIVRGDPADAEVLIDGQSRGAAGQGLSLPATPHRIEVRKAGFASFTTSVTPREGMRQIVEYQLLTPGEQRVATLPPAIRTALGQELRLVTGGHFVMGSPRREPGRRGNEAERSIELKRPFYFGVKEVTNQEFRRFRAEHASGIFKEETLDLDRQPVVRVSWQDAAAFCNWLSAREGLAPAYASRDGRLELVVPVTTGYRMPTEAEWEFVARNDGQAATLKYPWGNALPVAAKSGNYADQSAMYLTPVVISGYDDGFRVSAPVGSFASNPLGMFDLGGNVSEWATDHYSIYVPDPGRTVVDPVGPQEGSTWVIRGASWLTGRTPDLRLAWRDPGAAGKPDLGFRLARYASQE